MTISSNQNIPQNIRKTINLMLNNVYLKLHIDKNKRFSKNEYKEITGYAVVPSGMLKIPKSKEFEIVSLRDRFNNGSGDDKLKKKLTNKLSYARQIEPNFLESEYRKLIVKIVHAL
jgi:hypothetical protein